MAIASHTNLAVCPAKISTGDLVFAISLITVSKFDTAYWFIRFMSLCGFPKLCYLCDNATAISFCHHHDYFAGYVGEEKRCWLSNLQKTAHHNPNSLSPSESNLSPNTLLTPMTSHRPSFSICPCSAAIGDAGCHLTLTSKRKGTLRSCPVNYTCRAETDLVLRVSAR